MSSGGRWELASPMAMEILDEMVTVLDECGAVLLALAEEVTLNLDELSQTVDLARSDAVGAFKAASLLYFNAELSDAWTDNWSRPRAIFARHSEAVSDGATRVRPATPTSRINPAEAFQRELTDAERSRSSGQADRPQCSATAKSTGRACSRSALALGPSEFLAHCYGHLEKEERAQYDSYQYQLAEWQRQERGAAAAKILKDARDVAEVWVERRRNRTDVSE